MSNTVCSNLVYQRLLCPSLSENHTVLGSSAIPVNTLFHSASSNQAAFGFGKLELSKRFLRRRTNMKKMKQPMGKGYAHSFTAKAVLTADSASEVSVTTPHPSSMTRVEIQVAAHTDSLVLHWGAISDRKEKWILPSCHPDDTKVYENMALRTPFVKMDSTCVLKIEIDDPMIKALEFLILDEAHNKWFKNNGENFHVKLSLREKLPDIPVPEDLVQIQAYLRWERKGKQIYSPAQEKEEYEAARLELLEEIACGNSIEELQQKLVNRNERKKETSSSPVPAPVSKDEIPTDLVQIQAYIRWEKAGKPNYSLEKQQMEFEEARKELQELKKGSTLEEMRKMICKGEIASKVSKQLQGKKYFRVEKIQRKHRDIRQLISTTKSKPVVEATLAEPEALTAVEFFVKAMEQQDGNTIIRKTFYKINDKELLVLVSKPADKLKIRFATDFSEPITLHWGLSLNKAGEWLEPPSASIPAGSISQTGAIETPCFSISSVNPFYQVQGVEIEVEDGSYIGMPFVLRSGRSWIKNKDTDFYIEFNAEYKRIYKDIDDGKGTDKSLLNKIASMEGEAQNSEVKRKRLLVKVQASPSWMQNCHL